VVVAGGEVVRDGRKVASFVKHLGKEGSSPIELAAFVPLIALLVAFGIFWAKSAGSSESAYTARNIAEIRAENPPGQAERLERAFLREVSRLSVVCEVSPPAGEWYSLAQLSEGTGFPVGVSVACGGQQAGQTRLPGSSPPGAGASPPESLGGSAERPSSCGAFIC